MTAQSLKYTKYHYFHDRVSIYIYIYTHISRSALCPGHIPSDLNGIARAGECTNVLKYSHEKFPTMDTGARVSRTRPFINIEFTFVFYMLNLTLAPTKPRELVIIQNKQGGEKKTLAHRHRRVSSIKYPSSIYTFPNGYYACVRIYAIRTHNARPPLKKRPRRPFTARSRHTPASSSSFHQPNSFFPRYTRASVYVCIHIICPRVRVRALLVSFFILALGVTRRDSRLRFETPPSSIIPNEKPKAPRVGLGRAARLSFDEII